MNNLNLPEKFLERMKIMLKDEYEAFLKCYESEPKKGIRLNTLKCEKEKLEGLVKEYETLSEQVKEIFESDQTKQLLNDLKDAQRALRDALDEAGLSDEVGNKRPGKDDVEKRGEKGINIRTFIYIRTSCLFW